MTAWERFEVEVRKVQKHARDNREANQNWYASLRRDPARLAARKAKMQAQAQARRAANG